MVLGTFCRGTYTYLNLSDAYILELGFALFLLVGPLQKRYRKIYKHISRKGIMPGLNLTRDEAIERAGVIKRVHTYRVDLDLRTDKDVFLVDC